MATGFQVVFDCADPDRVARFWADALHYKLQDPPPGFDSWDAFLDQVGVPAEQRNDRSACSDPEGRGPRLFFQKVPEGKTAKNRVHLDVNVGGEPGTALDERRLRVNAELERLVEAAATKLQPMEQHGEYWVVMQDPEGNEFCLQ